MNVDSPNLPTQFTLHSSAVSLKRVSPKLSDLKKNKLTIFLSEPTTLSIETDELIQRAFSF